MPLKVVAIALLVGLIACGDGDAPATVTREQASIGPHAAQRLTLRKLRLPASVAPSALVAMARCQWLGVDASRGIVFAFRTDAERFDVLLRIQPNSRGIDVQPLADGEALVVIQDPPLVATLNTRNGSSVRHELSGDRSPGSVVRLANGWFAQAPISSFSAAANGPVTFPIVRLALIDPRTGQVNNSGEVFADPNHEYRPLWENQVALAALGDTLLEVRLADAKVLIYTVTEDGSTVPAGSRQLEKYFDNPPYYEEVWDPHWIQKGAKRPLILQLRHVEAVFAPEGGPIYLERNYSVGKVANRNRFFDSQYVLRADEGMVEVYGRDLSLRTRYAFPRDSMSFLGGDRYGRTIFRTDSTVWVAGPQMGLEGAGEVPEGLTSCQK